MVHRELEVIVRKDKAKAKPELLHKAEAVVTKGIDQIVAAALQVKTDLQYQEQDLHTEEDNQFLQKQNQQKKKYKIKLKQRLQD